MSEPPAPYAWAVLVVLTCLSGCFSGLNLGLMSLTVEDLNIIIDSSDDETQVRNAKKIKPLRERGNLLLCTLLIGNTVVNVCLSVVTDPIWTWMFGFGSPLVRDLFALAIPSALIVCFGEILPQSVCSRYALTIGAKTLPLTYFFVALTFPFSWPISVLLDRLLGDEISGVYTREGLFQLIKLNVESAAHAKGSGLTKEDAKILGGALTFKDTLIGDVMTPLSRIFSLPMNSVLDEATFMKILKKGHTRVPIYEGEPSNIVAVLLVKNLLGIGFERQLALKDVIEMFDGNALVKPTRVYRVPQTTKLNEALDVCKKRRVHMLIVTEGAGSPPPPDAPPEGADDDQDGVRLAAALGVSPSTKVTFVDGRDTSSSSAPVPLSFGPAVGIATMEDFLEEILQEEIVDETDVYLNNEYSHRETRALTQWVPTEDRTSATRDRESPDLETSSSGRELSKSRVSPLKRLNSKHFDTTVVLRTISRAGSRAGKPWSSSTLSPAPALSPGSGGVELEASPPPAVGGTALGSSFSSGI